MMQLFWGLSVQRKRREEQKMIVKEWDGVQMVGEQIELYHSYFPKTSTVNAHTTLTHISKMVFCQAILGMGTAV